MTRPVRLEVFDIPQDPAALQTIGAEAAEEQRLAAFDEGYKAGWDDAVAAGERDAERLNADIGRRLQELAFTYEEARMHVLTALAPALQDMAATVLPRLARATLGMWIAEALAELATRDGDAPVTIAVAPAHRAAVEALLAQHKGPPHVLVDDPTLGAEVVTLRLGEHERRLDLDAACAAVDSAVSTFLATLPKEKRHA